MAAKRFNVGDLVILKKDLPAGQLYGDFYCTRRMRNDTEGKLLRIERVDNPPSYKVDKCVDAYFTDEMLDPVYDYIAEFDKNALSDWNYKKHIDAPFKLKIKTKRIKFNFNN